MVCRNCNRKNPKNAGYCNYCGSPLDGTVRINRTSGNQTATINKKKSDKIVGLLVVIILLLIVLLAFLAKDVFFEDSGSVANESDNITYQESVEDVTDENVVGQESADAYTDAQEQVPATTESTPVNPKPTVPSSNINNGRNAQREAYLKRAGDIEAYSSAYFEKASTQHDLNKEAYNVFEKWDVLLNEVYKYLKTTMPKEEFAALEADELEWIKEKEAAVEAEAKLWEGGSGEPMARYAMAASYTKDRCYYLINLIK